MSALIHIDADGRKRGADPRELTSEQLEHAGMIGRPVLDAIRAKCLDCCCKQRTEVLACATVTCALWPHRMGTNPFRAPREMSDEQRQAAAERLSRARAARSER